jgi:hypothetical protein
VLCSRRNGAIPSLSSSTKLLQSLNPIRPHQTEVWNLRSIGATADSDPRYPMSQLLSSHSS